MKSKYVVFIFVLVALILGGVFYLTKNYGKKDEVSGTHAKVVTPKGNNKNESGTDSEKQNVNFDSENFDTFITLLPSETLINSITFDINNDGYDDEIITVRKTGTEDFTIVPGIYNDVTNDYGARTTTFDGDERETNVTVGQRVQTNAYDERKTHEAHAERTITEGEQINTFTHRRRGNLGVQTSQSMIQQERQVAMFNLYELIFDDIMKATCIPIYA